MRQGPDPVVANGKQAEHNRRQSALSQRYVRQSLSSIQERRLHQTRIGYNIRFTIASTHLGRRSHCAALIDSLL